MISIIIPLFNRETLILATLESVLCQSDSHWECIIIDDGSTDHSYQVVSDFIKDDSRFRLFARPDNYKAGANGARNFGFQQSKGKYINFIDSDDILHPDFVKYKLEAISTTNADVVISKTVVTTMDITEVRGFEGRTRLSDSLLDDFITLKVSWYIADPIWKKQFLLHKKLFNENLLKGQDRDFHIRMLLEKPKIELLDKYLYYYRRNSNRISTNISVNTALTMLEVGLKRNKHLLENNINNETHFFLYRQMIKLYPYVYKSKKANELYFKVIQHFFKFKRKHLLITFKFFMAIISFQLFGKGQKLLRYRI